MRKDLYKTAADLVAISHFLFIALILVGFFVAVFKESYRWYVLIVCLTMMATWAIRTDCPLVTLENKLRRHHDPKTAYSKTFIEYYSAKYLPIMISDRIIRITASAILMMLIVRTFI